MLGHCFADSNSNGTRKNYESIELSEETIPNQPITIVPTNETFSTQGSHPKSHIIVMSSSDSQSNSTKAMASYHSNQSAISTRMHHGTRSSLELTTPVPKYQHIMPRIPSWTSQYDYLPSNNNAWYYPPLSPQYMQLQKFPRKDETLLYTGNWIRKFFLSIKLISFHIISICLYWRWSVTSMASLCWRQHDDQNTAMPSNASKSLGK
jgi:hypothetical protein